MSKIPEPDSWLYGDIDVDENNHLQTYRFAMLFSFKSLEDFRAAKAVIEPLIAADARAKP